MEFNMIRAFLDNFRLIYCTMENTTTFFEVLAVHYFIWSNFVTSNISMGVLFKKYKLPDRRMNMVNWKVEEVSPDEV